MLIKDSWRWLLPWLITCRWEVLNSFRFTLHDLRYLSTKVQLFLTNQLFTEAHTLNPNEEPRSLIEAFNISTQLHYHYHVHKSEVRSVSLILTVHWRKHVLKMAAWRIYKCYVDDVHTPNCIYLSVKTWLSKYRQTLFSSNTSTFSWTG